MPFAADFFMTIEKERVEKVNDKQAAVQTTLFSLHRSRSYWLEAGKLRFTAKNQEPDLAGGGSQHAQQQVGACPTTTGYLGPKQSRAPRH